MRKLFALFRRPPASDRKALPSWSELSNGRIKDLGPEDEPAVEARFRTNMARAGLTRKQQDLAIQQRRAEVAAKQRQ